MISMLMDAAKIAVPTNQDFDMRGFWLGCIGIRNDGVIVSSKNGATKFSTVVENYQLLPNSHAEGRLLRKLGKYGTIFIARVSRKGGAFKMSRPCQMCRTRIAAAKVKRVYYSIDNQYYGIWCPNKKTDLICEI